MIFNPAVVCYSLSYLAVVLWNGPAGHLGGVTAKGNTGCDRSQTDCCSTQDRCRSRARNRSTGQCRFLLCSSATAVLSILEEDVSPYADVPLGAAVRSIHTSCRQVLERYLKLEPIIASEEDQPVTVPAGLDPAAIKLVGNVTGQPPIRGLLRHRGWRVAEVNLPSLPQGSGRTILAPAEVEVS